MIRAGLTAIAIMALAPSGAVARDFLNTAPSPGRPHGPWYGMVSGGYEMIDGVAGSGGGNTASVDTDGGYAFAAALGYKWPGNIRTEFEVSYHSNSVGGVTYNGRRYDASGDVQAVGYSVNGYYDIATGTKVRPYLGGGLGGIHQMLDRASVAGVSVNGGSRDDVKLHGEIGLGYDLGREVTVGPAYRYTHIFNGDQGWDDTTSHQFKLGLRFPFR
jgi:opacity protein-like surface antigen